MEDKEGAGELVRGVTFPFRYDADYGTIYGDGRPACEVEARWRLRLWMLDEEWFGMVEE